MDDLSSSVATVQTSAEASRSVSPAPPRRYKFSTECVTIDNPQAGKDQYNSSSVPIYQSATFKGMNGEYDYSRSGNPTRTHLQHHLAKISAAKHAFAVSSGMAALDVIARILKPGDHVIAGDDLYGGSNRLLGYLKSNAGVIVHHIDTCTPSTVEQYLDKHHTKLVLLETPTNPLIKICDVRDVADRVKSVCPDAIVVVDNTMMSPYLQCPLTFGADVVYDSATKYLSGHHDLMAGVIVCNRDDLAKHMAFTINSVGNGLGPFDSFLLLRGLKTLAIRMDRQQASAKIIASFLNQLGFDVHYPGLKNHPGHDIHFQMSKDAGAVLSFETKDIKTSERIVGSAKLWGISVSFGAVNSLISMPCLMSHASIPAHLRAERGLPEDLIRLCVGIEDWEDLIDDLESSLVQAGAIRPRVIPADDVAFSSEHGSLERVGEERALAWERCSFAQEVKKGVKSEADAAAAQSVHSTQPQDASIVVSAPGKVILFGEHAVVHGVTAIASSLDLRCYGCLTPRADRQVSLVLPDLNTDYTARVADLPWSAVSLAKDGVVDIDHALVLAIEKHVSASRVSGSDKVKGAIVAFLHHYMSLCYSSKPAVSFAARSTIPIGAGLGSSAAYSTCVSSALLLLVKKISIERTHHATHISHDGRRYISQDIASTVNGWSFISEKILHGTPSGIDNSVSVYGGAISYSRVRDEPMVNLNAFKSMRLLLTNSNVERDAKKLIAGVHAFKANEEARFDQCMKTIQDIVDEAMRCFEDGNLSRDVLLEGLMKLVQENQTQLDTLGVSHPALEMIISKLGAYNLKTKLTGAGGGGCTVTLLPDSLSSKEIDDVANNLQSNGFSPHVTTVGGSGFGYLLEQSQQGMRTQDSQAQESVGPFADVFNKQYPHTNLAEKLKECGKHDSDKRRKGFLAIAAPASQITTTNMADEFEEGPDPFMVDLGESSEGALNMLEESHMMDSSQQTQSANSLAFELAAAFGGSGVEQRSSGDAKNGRNASETPVDSKPTESGDEIEDVEEVVHTHPHSTDNEDSFIDDSTLEQYNQELNAGIEVNAKFLNNLKDFDSGLPLLESTATVVVKKLVETAKIREDQSRQLWELDKELSKEEDWVLGMVDPLQEQDSVDESDNPTHPAHPLDSIEEDEEDNDNDNDNKKSDNTNNTQKEDSRSSSSTIPSLEGFIDEYILQSLSTITEISQISTATLNESSRKTRAMRSTLSSIKSEDERTRKAQEVIDRVDSKNKASLKGLLDGIQMEFLSRLNQLSEWVDVQGQVGYRE